MSDRDGAAVWLVFHGMRHHIVSPLVYDALFSGVDGIVIEDDLEDILQGPDLNDGTCLARGTDGGGIFLVTGYPETKVRRHYIQSKEVFDAFGFDEALVQEVPSLILEAIKEGYILQSVLEDNE